MATTEETADQVAKARLALEAAEAEHAAALSIAEDNRDPAAIALDLFEAIVMRLGNRPQLAALLEKLKLRTAQPAPAPAAEPETKAA
jgi:hypothetical protein